MSSSAYQFSSNKSLYQMEPLLNQAGDWQWIVRDCAWYPDFLQCRPSAGVRICIYEVKPPGGPLYRVLVEIEPEAKNPSVKGRFLELLEGLAVTGLVEIPAGAWPFD